MKNQRKVQIISIVSMIVLLLIRELVVPADSSVIRWVTLIGIFVILGIYILVANRKKEE